jgi:hypothetical protein
MFSYNRSTARRLQHCGILLLLFLLLFIIIIITIVTVVAMTVEKHRRAVYMNVWIKVM